MFFRATLLGRIAYLDEPLLSYRSGGLSDSRTTDWLGLHMRLKSWELGFAHAFLKDLERSDHLDRAACEAVLRARIARDSFEVRVWRANQMGRLGLLPDAARRTLESGDGRFLRETLKHAAGPLYQRFYNRRYGPGWASAVGGEIVPNLD
jgi:hypothetical protein